MPDIYTEDAIIPLGPMDGIGSDGLQREKYKPVFDLTSQVSYT